MICNKVKYRTKLDAKIALASTQRASGNSNRNEKRYYYCSKCRGWHLTSQRRNK